MCLQLGRSSVQTTWLPVVVWNPHPQRVQTRPDDKILDKIEQKKGKRKKGKEEKITESVPSFSQSKTRTGGCFVKMISQRSVKVKHKAEVKDKHNSCVLSASGDEPNLTSRTAAWQPEINAHVPLPLEWCASDFLFLKIWSYSRFFFFGNNAALGPSWRVRRKQPTSKDICPFWRVDGNENKRQSAPGVPFESTTKSPCTS